MMVPFKHVSLVGLLVLIHTKGFPSRNCLCLLMMGEALHD